MSGPKLLVIFLVLMSVKVNGRISRARRGSKGVPPMHRKMLGLPGLTINADGIMEVDHEVADKPEDVSDSLIGVVAFLVLAAFVTNQVMKELNARKFLDTCVDPQRATYGLEAKNTDMDASCKVTLRDIHNLKEFTASTSPKAVLRARYNSSMKADAPHNQRDFACMQTVAY